MDGERATEKPAFVVLRLFGVVVSGQIGLRKIDGWRTMATVLRQRMRSAV